MNIEVGDRVTFKYTCSTKTDKVYSEIVVTKEDIREFENRAKTKFIEILYIERPKYEVIKWNY